MDQEAAAVAAAPVHPLPPLKRLPLQFLLPDTIPISTSLVKAVGRAQPAEKSRGGGRAGLGHRHQQGDLTRGADPIATRMNNPVIT